MLYLQLLTRRGGTPKYVESRVRRTNHGWGSRVERTWATVASFRMSTSLDIVDVGYKQIAYRAGIFETRGGELAPSLQLPIAPHPILLFTRRTDDSELDEE